MTCKCESDNLTFILNQIKNKSTNLEGHMLNHSSQLFHYVVRLNKEDSAFFYFQLEANDGLCFYSTLPYEPHTQYRDIDLKGDILLHSEIKNLLERCQQKFKIDILTNETIPDQKASV
jgi:hypothetical protein